MSAQQEKPKRQHARFSPSKLGNKEVCPRFDYEEPKEGEVNEAADEGEQLHAAVETGDTSGLVNDEQIEQVTKCQMYSDSLKAGRASLVELREIKLEVPDITYGYVDHVIFDPVTGEAHVIDYKFGRKGATEAKDNVQVMCYAAALLFGWVHYESDDGVPPYDTVRKGGFLLYGVPGTPTQRPTSVTCHIVAPRLNLVSSHTYTLADKDAILARLNAILRKTENPFSPACPDPDLCPNCKWRAECPAVNKMAVAATTSMSPMLPTVFELAQLETLPPAELSKIYGAAQILEGWAESAKSKIAERAIRDSVEIPYYTQVQRAGKANVGSVAEVVALVEEVEAVPRDVVLQSTSLSLAKLIDSIAEHKGEKKRDTKERLEELLAPFVSRSPTIKFLQRQKGVTDKVILTGGTGLPELGMELPEG